MGRRGPEQEYVKDDDRNPIVGLIVRKDGRYAAKGENGKYKTFGTDRKEAIRRFSYFQSEAKREYVDVLFQQGEEPDPDKWGEVLRDCDGDKDIWYSRLPENAYWERVAKDLTERPKYVARKTGIEQVGYLDELERPGPSMPLEDFLKHFIQAKSGMTLTSSKKWWEDFVKQFVPTDSTMTRHELSSSKLWWTEFCQFTGCNLIADLDRDAFIKYRERVLKEQATASPYGIIHRFQKIKSIINYMLDESKINVSKGDRQRLEYRSVLKPPSKPSPNPTKLTRDELHSILNAGTDLDKAAVLLALNGAFTQIDLQRTTWDMIDWDERTLRLDRTKSTHLTDKPLPRICALWDRTIESLNRIRQGNGLIFLKDKEPVTQKVFRNSLKRAVRKAGIGRKIVFKYIRKSALSAAARQHDVPERQIKLLGGHSSGIAEHYVVREQVANACAAIEKFYFL